MFTGRRCGGTGRCPRRRAGSGPRRRLEAREHAKQSRLAAAGRPEQREEFAPPDIEREPSTAVTAPKRLLHRLEAEQRLSIAVFPVFAAASPSIPRRRNASRRARAGQPDAQQAGVSVRRTASRQPPYCARGSRHPCAARNAGRVASAREPRKIGAEPGGEPGEIGRAERRRLHHLRPVDRASRMSARNCMAVSLAVMPPSTRRTVRQTSGQSARMASTRSRV